jgi:aerobic C4-dicarboxylate transport protein
MAYAIGKFGLSTLGTVPAAGIMLIFGIDKFMSECRALVNFYGNAVATLVIAKWDRALDIDRARQVLPSREAPELSDPQEPAPAHLPTETTSKAAEPALR